MKLSIKDILRTLETVRYIEVVLNSEVRGNIQWLYRGHIGTLETVLYIEVVLNDNILYKRQFRIFNPTLVETK